MVTPELKEKLSKIYELSRRGTDGEKIAAQAMLDKLLSKYNLNGIDLNSLDKNAYELKWRSKVEFDLLCRIVGVILDDVSIFKRSKCYWNDRVFVFNLTYLEHIKLSCAYDYFRKHMQGEWKKVSIPILSKCRKAKTRSKRRSELQGSFAQHYFIESGLYKPEELTVVESDQMSKSEVRDRVLMSQSVKGGKYNSQVSSGHLIG